MSEKWYNRKERVWTERRQQMNFQQLSNLQYWTSLFSSPWSIAINLFDILIVVYILYRFTKAIAGTKIMILVRGVVIFVLAQVVANILGLTTISWLINQIITYGVIAAVVIFSPEIRTGLERLGRATDFFSTAQISAEEQMIRAFVKSVEYMSPRKIGALVAIQRVRTLQEYIATGIPLDANISAELLINIFIPNTPLHDGAVIIRENRIAVTSAYLPLTKNTGISKFPIILHTSNPFPLFQKHLQKRKDRLSPKPWLIRDCKKAGIHLSISTESDFQRRRNPLIRM